MSIWLLDATLNYKINKLTLLHVFEMIRITMTPNRRFLYWLIGGVAVCNLIVACVLFYSTVNHKEGIIRGATLNAQNLLQAISQSIQSESDRLSDSLQIVAFALERQLRERHRIDSVALAAVIAEHRTFHQETSPWMITDENGNVILKEGAQTFAPENLATSRVFQTLRHGPQTYVQLTDFVRSGEASEQSIFSARSYHNPDGAFAGVIVAPMPVTHFQERLSKYKLSPNSLLSVISTQDVLIALRAEEQAREVRKVGQPLVMSKEYMRLRAQGLDAAVYHAKSVADGVQRLYAYKRVGQSDLIVSAGMADSDYLKPWYESVRVRVAVFMVLALISLQLSRVLCVLWRKQERYAKNLELNNARLQDLLRVREVGLYELDFTTGRWSPSVEQECIFGIDEQYPRTKEAWTKLIHPDDLPLLLTAVKRDFGACASAYEYEYRIIRPIDGKTRWVQVIGRFEYLPDRSPARMFGAIKDVTSLRESQQRISYLAYYDELTGLPNRALLTERLQQEMLHSRRRGGTLAICSLDLDDFKRVNDRLGRLAGDLLLVEVARRITCNLREEDTVARIGGDEFVLLFGGMAQVPQVNVALDRIRGAIAQPFVLEDMTLTISASMGVTAYPGDNATDADTMLRHADQAMHEAKHEGKNAVHWFDHETDRRLLEARVKYERLVQAFEHHEFVLHYQPKVNLSSGEVESVEALIRWMHPEEGLIPPARFLPYIENTDLCIPLGEWVMREALRQNQIWCDAGVVLKVSINVFPAHLQRIDFVQRLALILEEFPRLPFGSLEIEVLETSLLEDLTDVSRCIQACGALGVDFSLDDFGTGYASLTYFSRLPVKTVKIDQSFIRSILNSPADLALVRSIVSMSHSIGRVVVAEGVEAPEYIKPLIACGCDIAQGYGISRPVAGEQIPAWVNAWRKPDAWHDA